MIIVDAFLKLVCEERDKAANDIIAGVPKDYAEYQRQRGIVEGLQIALRIYEQARRSGEMGDER